MSPSKIVFAFLVFVPFLSVSQPSPKSPKLVTGGSDWMLNDLVLSSVSGIRIAGKPESINCKYGKALLFNGSSDGVFLDQMPLEGLEKFTIEIIICPHSGGTPEQRYFHSGDVKGNRVLLELRSTPDGWYLDAFVKSGNEQKTLIDPALKHPLDQWAHIAFVVEHGKQQTFINGIKELESSIEFAPLHGGRTSIGVRQSETSWFRGEIYEIRISGDALVPSQFLRL